MEKEISNWHKVTVTSKANLKIQEIYLKYWLIHDIGKTVDISLSPSHFILKRTLQVRQIPARWISHTCILTDDTIAGRNTNC